MKRIELAYRSQLLSYENASKQLEIQVTKNFFSLITMKANVAYMEQSLETAAQKMNSDRIARQNGLLSELAWLNSQLSVQTARYNLSSAQGSYQNALMEFLATLGMDAASDVILDGTIVIAPVELDPERLILEYLPKRSDIVSQRNTIERLELTKDITALNAQVFLEAFPGEVFNAAVDEVSPVLDAASRTLRIRLRFSGSTDQRIKAGMFASVSLVTNTRRDVPVIPRGSLINTYGSWIVFTVNERSIASRSEVFLGLENENFVEIIGGLEVGELVVSAGQNFLTDGDLVRIVE